MLRHGIPSRRRPASSSTTDAAHTTTDLLHRFLDERIRQAAIDSSAPHARDFCACAIADRFARALYGKTKSGTTTTIMRAAAADGGRNDDGTPCHSSGDHRADGDRLHVPDPFVCSQRGRLDFLVDVAVKELLVARGGGESSGDRNGGGFDLLLNQPSNWEASLGVDIESAAAAVVDDSVSQLLDVALPMLSPRVGSRSHVPLDTGKFGCVVGKLVVALDDLFDRVVVDDDDDAGLTQDGSRTHQRFRSDEETRSLLQILLDFDPSLATRRCGSLKETSPLSILARQGKELCCRYLIKAGCPLLLSTEDLSVAPHAAAPPLRTDVMGMTPKKERLKRVVSGPPLPAVPEYQATVCDLLGDVAGLATSLQIPASSAYQSDVVAGSQLLRYRLQRDSFHKPMREILNRLHQLRVEPHDAATGLLACHLWTRQAIYPVISAILRNSDGNQNEQDVALATAGMQAIVANMDSMLAWLPCEPSVTFRGTEDPKTYPISGAFTATSRWFDVGLKFADRAAARKGCRGAILIVTTMSGALLQAMSDFVNEGEVLLPRSLRLICTGHVPPDVRFALGSHRHRILFVRPVGEFVTPQTAARVAYDRSSQLCAAYRGCSPQHPSGSRARVARHLQSWTLREDGGQDWGSLLPCETELTNVVVRELSREAIASREVVAAESGRHSAATFPPAVALIGEAGAGKSLACMDLVGRLMDDNVMKPLLDRGGDTGATDPVVSIFVSLCAVPRLFQDGSLDQYLTSYLGLNDALELECFIETYRLILVLDALDEVLAFGGATTVEDANKLRRLLHVTSNPLSNRCSLVVITCRSSIWHELGDLGAWRHPAKPSSTSAAQPCSSSSSTYQTWPPLSTAAGSSLPTLMISSTLRLAPFTDQEAQSFFKGGNIATAQRPLLCRAAATLHTQMVLQPVHLQMLLRMAEVDRTFPSERTASTLTAWQLFELYIHRPAAMAPVHPGRPITEELMGKAVSVMEALALDMARSQTWSLPRSSKALIGAEDVIDLLPLRDEIIGDATTFEKEGIDSIVRVEFIHRTLAQFLIARTIARSPPARHVDALFVQRDPVYDDIDILAYVIQYLADVASTKDDPTKQRDLPGFRQMGENISAIQRGNARAIADALGRMRVSKDLGDLLGMYLQGLSAMSPGDRLRYLEDAVANVLTLRRVNPNAFSMMGEGREGSFDIVTPLQGLQALELLRAGRKRDAIMALKQIAATVQENYNPDFEYAVMLFTYCGLGFRRLATEEKANGNTTSSVSSSQGEHHKVEQEEALDCLQTARNILVGTGRWRATGLMVPLVARGAIHQWFNQAVVEEYGAESKLCV